MITSLYHSPSKFLHPAPLDHKVVLSSPPTISVTSSAPMVANEGQEMQPKTDGSQNSKNWLKHAETMYLYDVLVSFIV